MTEIEPGPAFKGHPAHRVLIDGEYVGRVVKIGSKFQARRRTSRGPGTPVGLFRLRREAIDALA